MYSTSPSLPHLTLSPVRYALLPSPTLLSSGTNLSAVFSASLTYPLPTPAPPTYNSPIPPATTSPPPSLFTYNSVFAIPLPIGTPPLSSPSLTSYTLHPTTVSVGPYSFIILIPFPLHFSTSSHLNS